MCWCLTYQSTICSVMSGRLPVILCWTWTACKQRIKCLTQGHNAVPPANVELAIFRSQATARSSWTWLWLLLTCNGLHRPYSNVTYTWVKVYRILKLTIHRKSASKCWIREIIIASLINDVSLCSRTGVFKAYESFMLLRIIIMIKVIQKWIFEAFFQSFQVKQWRYAKITIKHGFLIQ